MSKATRARDRGMKRVAKNNNTFMEQGLAAVKKLRKRKSGYIGEDIRMALTDQGIQPSHHNAWGALIRKATIDGLIVPTKEYRARQSEQSHASKSLVYMINR